MNQNTKFAKKHGFSSMHDMNTNGNKVFEGAICNTAWDNPNVKVHTPLPAGANSETGVKP
jgi:hypothetical protein